MTANDDELARARRYYDAFAPTYERGRDGHGRYHDLLDDAEVGFAARWARDRELLEVGCGTGLLLRRFSAIARRAVGVDLSPKMLERARGRALQVVEGSATDLPFADASFDVAVSFKTLSHVPDLGRALAEMARVVRPGGALIVELYNPRSLRAFLKRALPAGRVGEGTERDVLCRYDDRRALERVLPRGYSIASVRGVRVLTPAARILDLPLVGPLVAAAERALEDTAIAANFGGFVIYALVDDGR